MTQKAENGHENGVSFNHRAKFGAAFGSMPNDHALFRQQMQLTIKGLAFARDFQSTPQGPSTASKALCMAACRDGLVIFWPVKSVT